MNKKIAFIFLVFIVGVLISSFYSYSQSVFLEKELIRIASERTTPFIYYYFDTHGRFELNDAAKILNDNFGKEVSLSLLASFMSGGRTLAIDSVKTAVDEIYVQFKNGTIFGNITHCVEELDSKCQQLSESNIEKPAYCGNLSSIKQECETYIISQFPFNLKDLSLRVLVIDTDYGIIDKEKLVSDVLGGNITQSEVKPKVLGLDEQNAKMLTYILLLPSEAIITQQLSSYTREVLENCTSKSRGMNLMQKDKVYECSIETLNKIESLSNALLRDLRLTNLSIPKCAQYLPLLEAEALKERFNNRLATIKSPYLRLYYGIIVKSLDYCDKEVFEKLKGSNLPCYKPVSFSLTEKSIGATIVTAGNMAFCMSDFIKNELGILLSSENG